MRQYPRRWKVSRVTQYLSGREALKRALSVVRSEALVPPPRLSVSQWADRYAVLSPETSAEPGKFRAFAYQNGILDAVSDPAVTQVTVMKSARVGYTKCLDHIVGFFVHQDPSPVLIVQPRVEDAEDYSRTEIAPMLRDTAVLADIAGDLKAKDSNQRILKRVFRNGSSVSFVGANSPGGFRRITARVVLFDEVDGYPVGGAGDEGDQIALGTQRTVSFWNRKIVLGSTPTLKGQSRIEREWLKSDRRRYFVPCPHCGHEQPLKWQNLRWDKTEAGEHRPETAYFACEGAGCVIEEHDKPTMIANGRWVAEAPGGSHAGFHIWAAYSLFPNAAWRFLVEEFLRVRKDPGQLQTFVNLVLGETWEESAERVEGASLIARREPYGGDELPAGILAIFAGVDTQDNRLELQIVGWGANEETWVIGYEVIHGDPAQDVVWADLESHLNRTFSTQDGRRLRIQATCIDSQGHHAASVYRFCRTRRARRVFPTKGAAGARPIWPKRFSRAGSKGAETVFVVGVDTAKDALYGRLRIEKPGPGYVHFPMSDDIDDVYFDQLTAEQVVTRARQGRPYRVWVLKKPGARNEALDTFVMAMAARQSTGRNFVAHVPAPDIGVGFDGTLESPAAPAVVVAAQPVRVAAKRPSRPLAVINDPYL